MENSAQSLRGRKSSLNWIQITLAVIYNAANQMDVILHTAVWADFQKGWIILFSAIS